MLAIADNLYDNVPTLCNYNIVHVCDLVLLLDQNLHLVLLKILRGILLAVDNVVD